MTPLVSRVIPLLCLSLPLVAPVAARAAGAGAERPNVVFIIFDDLNDWVPGLRGHPQARTPNLDRVMKRGVTFTNNQCNAPICAPSRPSMLTGLYPHTARFFGGKEEDGVKENWSGPNWARPRWPDARDGAVPRIDQTVSCHLRSLHPHSTP